MIKKCILVFMQSTRYSCHTLMKLEFSRQIVEKHSNTKYHKNSSSVFRVVSFGRKVGRTDITKLILRTYMKEFTALWFS